MPGYYRQPSRVVAGPQDRGGAGTGGDPDQLKRPDQEPAAQRGIRQDSGQLALALLPGVPITRAFPASRPAAADAASGGTVVRTLRGTVPSRHPRDSYLKADPKVTE